MLFLGALMLLPVFGLSQLGFADMALPDDIVLLEDMVFDVIAPPDIEFVAAVFVQLFV